MTIIIAASALHNVFTIAACRQAFDQNFGYFITIASSQIIRFSVSVHVTMQSIFYAALYLALSVFGRKAQYQITVIQLYAGSIAICLHIQHGHNDDKMGLLT